MLSTFTLAFVLSAISHEGRFGTLGSQSGTFSFGQFNVSSYEVWEMVIFIAMGAGGGVFGAFFTWLNTCITNFRSRWITTRKSSVLEALVVALVVSMVTFGTSYAFGRCMPRPKQNADEKYTYRAEMIAFYCDDPENHYNDLATLFINSGEAAIKQLFHAPPGTFHVGNLVFFWIVSILLACWTYGLRVGATLIVH